MDASISIVIPVLNEDSILSGALVRLRDSTSAFPGIKVYISDSGSTDSSLQIASSFCAQNPRFRLIHRDFAGRPSISKALIQAHSYILTPLVVVCPVDVELDQNAITRLLQEIAASGTSIHGGFKKVYGEDSFLMKLNAAALNFFRSRLLGNWVWTNAPFFPTDKLLNIPSLGFMEDVAFCDQLKKDELSYRFFASPVRVSARRYSVDGRLERILFNILILALYRLNLCSVDQLRSLYQNKIRARKWFLRMLPRKIS